MSPPLEIAFSHSLTSTHCFEEPIDEMPEPLLVHDRLELGAVLLHEPLKVVLRGAPGPPRRKDARVVRRMSSLAEAVPATECLSLPDGGCRAWSRLSLSDCRPTRFGFRHRSRHWHTTTAAGTSSFPETGRRWIATR